MAFFMSWDTDAAGMPESLMLVVNDANGSVAESIGE